MDEEKGSIEDQHELPREPIVDMATITFTGHSAPVHIVAINPKIPNIAVSGGEDDKAYLWDVSNGNKIKTLEGHKDTIVAAAFSTDGTLVATGSLDCTVKVWNVSDGSLQQTLEGPTEDIEWIKWHTKGNVLLAGSSDATAWMWIASTGQCMQVFAGHESAVTCGSFTGSGKMICTGSADNTVRVWNPKTGVCAHVFSHHQWHDAPITVLECHPSQPLLLCGSVDGTARLANIQSKKVIGKLVHSGAKPFSQVDVIQGAAGVLSGGDGYNDSGESSAVEAVGFSHTHNFCATAGIDGFLKIWDMQSMSTRQTCKHESAILKLEWSKIEAQVITGAVDGNIRLWDALTGALLSTLTGHSDAILSLTIFTQGQAQKEASGQGASSVVASGMLVLTGSDDGSAKLFVC
jgi:WD40 repeat protein